MEMSTGVSLLRTAQSLLTGRTILEQNNIAFWACGYNMVQGSIVFHCVGPSLACQRNAIENVMLAGQWGPNNRCLLPPPSLYPVVRNAEFISCKQQRHCAACANAQSDQRHCYSLSVSDGR